MKKEKKEGQPNKAAVGKAKTERPKTVKLTPDNIEEALVAIGAPQRLFTLKKGYLLSPYETQTPLIHVGEYYFSSGKVYELQSGDFVEIYNVYSDINTAIFKLKNHLIVKALLPGYKIISETTEQTCEFAYGEFKENLKK